MIESEGLLVLPHLRVQNANAISSPLLWGFPSPTAFLGFVHALHRRVQPELGITLDGVGIVCHDFEAQTSQPSGKRTQVFHLSRNPVGSDGSTSAIVEEGRVHLEVSLVIGVSGAPLHAGALAPMAERIAEIASELRVAGGSLVPKAGAFTKAEMHLWPGTEDEEEKLTRRVRRRLLPGFALVSRETALDERFRELAARDPSSTVLDAFLDMASLNIEPESNGSNEWTIRRAAGWLVPISTGFRAISELYEPGVAKNARDRTTPFRFVEGIYTIGEWRSPHRIADLRDLLWSYSSEPNDGLYRCTTPQFSHLTSNVEGQ